MRPYQHVSIASLCLLGRPPLLLLWPFVLLFLCTSRNKNYSRVSDEDAYSKKCLKIAFNLRICVQTINRNWGYHTQARFQWVLTFEQRNLSTNTNSGWHVPFPEHHPLEYTSWKLDDSMKFWAFWVKWNLGVSEILLRQLGCPEIMYSKAAESNLLLRY